ncbi:hypothetical protein [Pelagibacterium luteolum]|uniref:Uncharacterized protein n=1 Tax=Pelagibacterium luteolum TaxID=440168 RepID=A0A1G7XI24_9HYPH|nr:hypothetical protein [Pelagibacterium luteolum]SDG83868.1 hypothetical protein SAMN04487974_109132 [Pelagibacterium luteolum]
MRKHIIRHQLSKMRPISASVDDTGINLYLGDVPDMKVVPIYMDEFEKLLELVSDLTSHEVKISDLVALRNATYGDIQLKKSKLELKKAQREEPVLNKALDRGYLAQLISDAGAPPGPQDGPISMLPDDHWVKVRAYRQADAVIAALGGQVAPDPEKSFYDTVTDLPSDDLADYLQKKIIRNSRDFTFERRMLADPALLMCIETCRYRDFIIKIEYANTTFGRPGCRISITKLDGEIVRNARVDDAARLKGVWARAHGESVANVKVSGEAA